MTYTAQITGAPWKHGPSAEFSTITAALTWAESYGTTADRCTIYRSGEIVAVHMRDTSGAGDRWFKASV